MSEQEMGGVGLSSRRMLHACAPKQSTRTPYMRLCPCCATALSMRPSYARVDLPGANGWPPAVSACRADAPAQPVRAGEAAPGAPGAGRGAAGGDAEGSPYRLWMERTEGWVRVSLEGAAELGAASRALAAALARAGALGAADRLADCYLDAHEDDSESEDRDDFVWSYLEEVLRAIGRHLPEVRAM